MFSIAVQYCESRLAVSLSLSFSLALFLCLSLYFRVCFLSLVSFHYQHHRLRSLSITYGSRGYYHRIVVAPPAAAADRPVSALVPLPKVL